MTTLFSSLLSTPVAVIMVAAGRGQRFGGDTPKQYLNLIDKPLLFHTLVQLHRHPLLNPILPVISPHDFSRWHDLVNDLKQLPKLLPPVAGGQERSHSVRNGVLALNLAPDAWVAIHDAARPFPSLAMLDRLLAARSEAQAIIPAVPASDTVKEVDQQGFIRQTLVRETIFLAQTPQLFRANVLQAAFAQAHNTITTDEAALVEQLGIPVKVVLGDPNNIKVTLASDWQRAEYLLQQMHSHP